MPSSPGIERFSSVPKLTDTWSTITSEAAELMLMSSLRSVVAMMPRRTRRNLRSVRLAHTIAQRAGARVVQRGHVTHGSAPAAERVSPETFRAGKSDELVARIIE
jgi:hypothetical protein